LSVTQARQCGLCTEKSAVEIINLVQKILTYLLSMP